eukprot:147528-Chlamydomonas_euryale.AAC.1
MAAKASLLVYMPYPPRQPYPPYQPDNPTHTAHTAYTAHTSHTFHTSQHVPWRPPAWMPPLRAPLPSSLARGRARLRSPTPAACQAPASPPGWQQQQQCGSAAAPGQSFARQAR